MTNKCPWCKPVITDESWSDDFCPTHEAEYEGITVDQLERIDHDQYAEELDARGYGDPVDDRFADQWQEYRDTFV